MKLRNSFLGKIFPVIFLILTIFFYTNVGYAKTTAMRLRTEGSLTKDYNEAQIKALPSISGHGGYYRVTTGTYSEPVKWRGVHLPLFLSSLVGEVDYNITVIAQDSYTANLTRTEIEGSIRTFDQENTTLNIKAIPCLAYEENDAPVSSDDGPLRLVFIGENNNSIITISPIWVKQVVTIRIETSEAPSTTTFEISSVTSSETSLNETPGFTIHIGILILILIASVSKRKIK